MKKRIRIGKKSIEVIYCDNMFSRCLGLMFRRKAAALISLPYPSRALAVIHTLFMRFPIDVYWLDEGMKVIDIRHNVKPWRQFIATKSIAKYILELPSGSLKLKIGKKISVMHAPY